MENNDSLVTNPILLEGLGRFCFAYDRLAYTEVCANGVESCLAAQAGGADRVELCAGIPEGGTTPSYGEVCIARKLLTKTRLHVIIRPRGGDFLYSPLELERMIADIDMCRQLRVDGVVFGCLTPQGDVDMSACRLLLQHTEGLSTTFHRAFDRCRDARNSLENIISLGFDRILTSGQKPTAEQGIPLLRQLQKQADGRIILLAGSGVNEQNIRRIHDETGICEFYFSAREPVMSRMEYTNPDLNVGSTNHDAGTIMQTTERRVRATIAELAE